MRLQRVIAAVCLVGLLFGRLAAAEFKLIDGNVFRGELVAADENGFVIRLDNGSFAPRTDWGKMTDETLMALADNPRARKFVEPFIPQPDPELVLPRPRPVQITEPNRVQRPETGKGLGAALLTPGGLVFLGALFAANLFVGYQVARFRWRPVGLVCAVSAVLPVVGPLIFLALPKNVPEEPVDETAEAVAAAQLTVADSGPSMVSQMQERNRPTGGGDELPKTFKRGEFTFNRRFFETQFPAFFRVVAGEADKDLVLDFQCARGQVVASRISRISQAELHVRTVSGAELPVEFAGITEITLRRKDA